MSKAVLISIKPQWCELIANGDKTIEVRKTRPKLDTPFKFYIYCCKPKKKLRYVWTKEDYKGLIDEKVYKETPDNYKVFCKLPEAYTAFHCSPYSGKVIGEFVCDELEALQLLYLNPESEVAQNNAVYPQTCLTDKQIIDYLGNGNKGYHIHISDLVIYDKPKELSEFVKIGDCDAGLKCKKCPYFERGVEAAGLEDDCIAPFDTSCYSPITRPPQSWCYVEELK